VKTLIVAGNCQAKNIADIFRRDPVFSARYRILYPAGIPGLGGNDVTEADAAACDLLFQQVGQGGVDVDFTNRDKLNPSASIVRFPNLMLYTLYPFFSSRNPYNEPRPPALPWGPFPYADSVILDLVEKDVPAPEILDIYLNHDERYAVDLDKLHRMELARSTALDRSCDVKTTDLLFSLFAQQRLFFTTLHPTPLVFREVTAQIVAACRSIDPEIATARVGETLNAILRTHPRGPHFSQIIPIHPTVHERYGLAWYDPNERFELGTLLVSYIEYFGAMIAEFARVRALRQAAATAAN